MTPPTTVRDHMSTDLIAARAEMSVHEAMDLLLEHHVSGLPIIDERGGIIGILTERDCLRVAYAASYYQDLGSLVGETMTREVETIDADADIATAIERFLNSPYRRLPVLQGTRLVGQISRRDVLRALKGLR
jgi:CBS domain-containing protein